MPLQLTVGLSKEVGSNDAGSLGANCRVTFEVDSALLHGDLGAFHRHVRGAYEACRQAVDDELARRNQQSRAVSRHNGNAGRAQAKAPGRDGNGSQPGSSQGHAATEKQLEYARQLAGQIKGFGPRRLESLAKKMFDRPLAALTILEASGLIDMLKAIKADEIDLERALNNER